MLRIIIIIIIIICVVLSVLLCVDLCLFWFILIGKIHSGWDDEDADEDFISKLKLELEKYKAANPPADKKWDLDKLSTRLFFSHLFEVLNIPDVLVTKLRPIVFQFCPKVIWSQNNYGPKILLWSCLTTSDHPDWHVFSIKYIGARMFALFVSTMHPLTIISSKMKCAFSRLNMIWDIDL